MNQIGPAVAVFGLGKLGSVVAAVIADSGIDVIGYDVNADTVDKILSRIAPVQEPGLQNLLDQLPEGRLQGALDPRWAVQNSDMTLIVVPTPSRRDGNFDATYVASAVTEIGAALRDMPDDWWHTVVVCSTLSPGTMRGQIAPALEEASGRRVGVSVGLAYNPLFIALGSVIEDLTNPDFMLIGAEDGRSQRDVFNLASHYQGAPAHTMSFTEAEMCKLAVNGYLSVKIAYANMVARLCRQVSGSFPPDLVSARRVLRAVGADRRIGNLYLRPGGNPGGPCLPRDLDAMKALGGSASLIDAAQTVSWYTTADVVDELVKDHDHIAILGYAYKPGTPVSDRSFAKDIIGQLAQRCIPGTLVRVHDPAATITPVDKPALEVAPADTPERAIAGATAVVIACPHPEYSELVFGNRTVIDPWGLLG